MPKPINYVAGGLLAAAVYLAAPAIAVESASSQIPIVEQYKAYLVDIGNIGARYTTAQTFFVSIISTLVAGISTLIAVFSFKDIGETKKRHHHDPIFYLACAALLSFVGFICMLWKNTLEVYRKIFEVKFIVLREMETKHANILDGIFTREHDLHMPRLSDQDIEIAVDIGRVAFVLSFIVLVVAVIIWARQHKKMADTVAAAASPPRVSANRQARRPPRMAKTSRDR
jgi:hypothetical protein